MAVVDLGCWIVVDLYSDLVVVLDGDPHWLEKLTLHGQARYTWEQPLVWLIEKHGWTW